METSTELSEFVSVGVPRAAHVEFWIWSNPEGTDRCSKIIEIQGGLTLYSALKKAEDSSFQLECEDYPHGKVITSIAGRKQSPEDKLYWMIYKIPRGPDFETLPSDVLLIKQGVEEAAVVDGDVYLLWLKNVDLETPRNH